MDKNTNQNNNGEKNNGTEYLFVRETIIDKKTRVKRGILKIISNFILILVVCVITCLVFINLTGSQNNGDDDKETTMPAETTAKQEETTTEKGTEIQEETTTAQELTEEEKIEKRISDSIVIFKAYGDEEVNTFPGIILSKSSGIVVLAKSKMLLDTDSIYCNIGELVDIPVDIIMEDDELGIALLKIDKNDIQDIEIENLVTATIPNSFDITIGSEIKYYNWMQDSGMTLLKGKVLSQGIVENATDISYIKYMIDVEIADAIDGFVFDNKGNFIALDVSYENPDGKINVMDLTGFKAAIYSIVNKGYTAELGIIGQKVTVEIEKLVGEELPDGMYVTEVKMDSSAYKAGIMVGDIIYKINSTSIEGLKDIRKFLDGQNKGNVVEVYLYRNMGTRYNTYTLPVELQERK